MFKRHEAELQKQTKAIEAKEKEEEQNKVLDNIARENVEKLANEYQFNEMWDPIEKVASPTLSFLCFYKELRSLMRVGIVILI